MAWWTDQRLHPKTKSKFVIVFGSTFFIPSVKTVSKPKIDFDTKEYRLLNHKFNYPGNGTWQPIELTFVDMNGLGDKSDTFDTSAFLWQILNNTGYAYPYLDGSSDTSNNAYYNNVADGKDVFSGGHHISTKISFRDDPNTDIRERSSFRTITTPEKSSTIANSFGKGLNGNIDYENAHYARQKISIYQLSPESKFDEGTDKNPSGAEIVECWHLVNPIVKSIGWGDLSYDSDDLVEYTMSIIYDWAIFDREKIGKDFVVDASPYQDFMKNYGLAQAAIDQETQQQAFEASIDELRESVGLLSAEELKDFNEKINSDRPQDLDGDGLISDVEAGLWSEQNQDIREGLALEADLRLANENREAFLTEPKENQEALRARAELEREEAELASQAALDEAFSDENIAEDVDALTDSLTLEEGVVIETGIDLRPEINESARLEQLTAISEKPENERTAEEQAALNQFKAEEQAERQADFDAINTSNAEQEILDEASTIIDAVPAGQTDEFVETLIEKVERGEASTAEIEIVTTELLRRGRANEDIDPADRDDTLDD